MSSACIPAAAAAWQKPAQLLTASKPFGVVPAESALVAWWCDINGLHAGWSSQSDYHCYNDGASQEEKGGLQTVGRAAGEAGEKCTEEPGALCPQAQQGSLAPLTLSSVAALPGVSVVAAGSVAEVVVRSVAVVAGVACACWPPTSSPPPPLPLPLLTHEQEEDRAPPLYSHLKSAPSGQRELQEARAAWMAGDSWAAAAWVAAVATARRRASRRAGRGIFRG